MIGGRPGRFDRHYHGFFECFNRGEFYEAHDVLEQLWLADKEGPKGKFYKGLIQLAGAFVHLQKGRLRPAGALFKLARTNFESYGNSYHGLEMGRVGELIERYLGKLEGSNYGENPLRPEEMPRLEAEENRLRLQL